MSHPDRRVKVGRTTGLFSLELNAQPLDFFGIGTHSRHPRSVFAYDDRESVTWPHLAADHGQTPTDTLPELGCPGTRRVIQHKRHQERLIGRPIQRRNRHAKLQHFRRVALPQRRKSLHSQSRPIPVAVSGHRHGRNGRKNILNSQAFNL